MEVYQNHLRDIMIPQQLLMNKDQGAINKRRNK